MLTPVFLPMSEFFGLDIGSHTIKAVQIDKKDGSSRLTHFSIYDTPPRVFESEAEEDRKALAKAVKSAVKEANIKSRKVVAALPESKLFTRVIELPQMSDKELSASLEYEAERYIPFPIDEATYDFEVVAKPEKAEKMQVLLVASPENLTRRYLDVLESAGLEVLALEPETVALTRALVGEGEKAQIPTLLVSIGSSSTDLIITKEGKIRFTRSVGTGGKALGRALARALGFEEEQAESYKKSYGLEEGQLEGKVSDVLKPVFKVIVEEMRRSLDFYESRRSGEGVKRIILSGGTANLPGVLVYLASEFGVEVQLANPWEDVHFSEEELDREKMEELGPVLAVAVGMALRKV